LIHQWFSSCSFYGLVQTANMLPEALVPTSSWSAAVTSRRFPAEVSLRSDMRQRQAAQNSQRRVEVILALAVTGAAALTTGGRPSAQHAHRLSSSKRRFTLTLRRQQSSGHSTSPLPVTTSARDEGNEVWLTYGRDKPGGALTLGTRVFRRELRELLAAIELTMPALTELVESIRVAAQLPEFLEPRKPPPFVEALKLDVEEVVRREKERGVPESTWVVKAIFFVLCWALDRLYDGRPIQKFWVLETVARLPYFSYITVIHLYESLGWWRTPQIRHIHCAEEDNELHHLLIMEALGGDCHWFDRFAAQHAALIYYWLVVGLFLAAPEHAYNFSLLVEEHAFVTYSEFVEANRELLQQVPAPPVAFEYYVEGDLYYFDKFQTVHHNLLDSKEHMRRRPPCSNLLEVFTNIRDDEYEHILTMKACQHWWAGDGPSPLPKEERRRLGKRKAWAEWSAKVNGLHVIKRATSSSS
jgi:hypothetical protein